MSGYKLYRKKLAQPMRPYVPGESLEDISVAVGDIPAPGGMIAVNPDNPKDSWYISPEFFQANYQAIPDET